MGGTGLERPSKSPGKHAVSQTRGAESGALGSEIDPDDPDLAELVTAWPVLAATIRAGIMAMVRATTGRDH